MHSGGVFGVNASGWKSQTAKSEEKRLYFCIKAMKHVRNIFPLNYNNIHILPVQTTDIFFMQNTIVSLYSHFEMTYELDMFFAAHVWFTFLVYFSVYDSHKAFVCLFKYLKSISPKNSKKAKHLMPERSECSVFDPQHMLVRLPVWDQRPAAPAGRTPSCKTRLDVAKPNVELTHNFLRSSWCNRPQRTDNRQHVNCNKLLFPARWTGRLHLSGRVGGVLNLNLQTHRWGGSWGAVGAALLSLEAGSC